MTTGEKLKLYYSLTKPRVTYGNVITTVAGFLLAAGGNIDWWQLLATTIGMTFVIGSACALNNYLDQDIDAKMARTKARALVQGKLPGRNAVIFSAVLGLLGTIILYLSTNVLTTVVAILGFIVYVVFYGMLSKRLSIHGTLVGSISGAAPILAGYTAVANTIDTGAVLVFLVLFLWQMPEFYSIAVYRRDEYKAAGVPVMSVVKGKKNTIVQIFVYTIIFVITSLLLTVFNYTGYVYLAIMGLLGVYWVWLGAKGLRVEDQDAWAHKMFHFSLVMLLVFSFMISIDSLLP